MAEASSITSSASMGAVPAQLLATLLLPQPQPRDTLTLGGLQISGLDLPKSQRGRLILT